MVKRKSRSVYKIVEQLRIGQRRSLRWISDGSASKICDGKLHRVELKANGLRLVISDHVVSWRLPKQLALQVFTSFYFPVAVPFVSTRALGFSAFMLVTRNILIMAYSHTRKVSSIAFV